MIGPLSGHRRHYGRRPIWRGLRTEGLMTTTPMPTVRELSASLVRKHFPGTSFTGLERLNGGVSADFYRVDPDDGGVSSSAMVREYSDRQSCDSVRGCEQHMPRVAPSAVREAGVNEQEGSARAESRESRARSIVAYSKVRSSPQVPFLKCYISNYRSRVF